MKILEKIKDYFSSQKYKDLEKEFESYRKFHVNYLDELHGDMQYLLRDMVHNVCLYPTNNSSSYTLNIELSYEEIEKIKGSSLASKYELLGPKIAREVTRQLQEKWESKKC